MCILYNQRDATYAVFFIIISALHVSGGFSAHHQELIQLYVQPWVLSCFPAVYRWCGWVGTVLYYYQPSTCFGRFFRPSSGAYKTVCAALGIVMLSCSLPLVWMGWNCRNKELHLVGYIKYTFRLTLFSP
jgi:hypothetical protein